ncbi:MAG TPA: chromate efflux transporter, partial [Thermodesulfobacteriota bacterium]|nr:chromate efflux transporter [Thermodesulfobacteriota bacterium]
MTAPGYFQLFRSFLYLGLTAFGGPAMVAHIRDLAVKKNAWLNEDRFKDGVALCQAIPGATAMQMAGYVGLQVKGIRGALATYTGFGLPAFLLMLLFSIFYKRTLEIAYVRSLFMGLQVLVVAIMAQAVMTFGRNMIKDRHEIQQNLLMALFSAALLLLGISPFLVVAAAGLIGVLIYPFPAAVESPSSINRLRSIIPLLFILAAGLTFLYLINPPYLVLSLLMMKIDLFAFGGGFTSLPLMLHEVVEVRKWMEAGILLDGIALGQVTPGPIVITAAFVGYWLYGLAGSLIGTLSIFTPSFLLLVTIQPLFNRLKSSSLFIKGSKGVLASFTGLLLYALIR